MSKEKITYEQMIDLLRDNQRSAPVSWEQIESSLIIDQGITELPAYKAPDNLWAGIEEGLEPIAPAETITPTVKRRNFNGLYFLLASILFFVSTLIAVNFLGGSNESNAFQYRSEIETASLQDNKVLLDDNIDEVMMYIESNSYMFSDEQLEEFNSQLAEINQALEKLLEMQEKYGIDDSSNKMMARMERDKANLLKTMIAQS